jgi:NAD(P)H-hydrate repair Nnr-like enzyme with NAD(P)H-hydrate epimerase domain
VKQISQDMFQEAKKTFIKSLCFPTVCGGGGGGGDMILAMVSL